MTLQDALFNWLQIKLVAEARPDDRAAKDTVDFFEQILVEDHGLEEIGIAETDDTMIHVRYRKDGAAKRKMFDRAAAGQLLTDINANPRYNE